MILLAKFSTETSSQRFLGFDSVMINLTVVSNILPGMLQNRLMTAQNAKL